MPNVCISSLITIKLAKKPITATDAKRMNCCADEDFDSVNTKNLVIKKLTITPKKKDMANESEELRTVAFNIW